MTYARQIETARRLVADKGRRCVWAQDRPAPETETPWKPDAGTTEKHDVNIVFLPTGGNKAFIRALAGTDAVIGDDMGLMAAVDFVPEKGANILASDGETMLRHVTVIDVIAPNGTPILYTLSFGVEGNA